MEEILELRRSIEEGRYHDALALIGEMEEMAKEDKISKIGSFMVVLMAHLIKVSIEKRMTNSWLNSILNSIDGINDTNGRRSARGKYLSEEGLRNELDYQFIRATREASREVVGGKYTAKEIAQLVDAEAIKAQALDYILNGYPESED